MQQHLISRKFQQTDGAYTRIQLKVAEFSFLTIQLVDFLKHSHCYFPFKMQFCALHCVVLKVLCLFLHFSINSMSYCALFFLDISELQFIYFLCPLASLKVFKKKAFASEKGKNTLFCKTSFFHYFCFSCLSGRRKK